MRRLPAIDHLDACGDGAVAVAHQVRRLDYSLLPGPVNHIFPAAKRPQSHAAFISDYLQFRGPVLRSGPLAALDVAQPLRRQFDA